MDKPIAMPVKEYLVRILSVRMNIPAKTIDAIIDHQMQGANEALINNFSVELSGFAKFIFNHKKAKKKMEKQLSKKAKFEEILLRPTLTDAQKKSNQFKLDNTIKWIENLKPKLDEFERYSGRMEKPSDATLGVERNDTDNLQREIKDML